MGTNINQVLKELCQDLGYKKKGYLFYKQLTSEVSSTVGFNISSGQTITHRSVAPQIGVRYETVERLLIEVVDEDWCKGFSSTISSPIGYLMPENKWIEWDFDKYCENVIHFVENLSSAVQKYAVSYYEKFATLDMIISFLEGLKFGSAKYDLFIRLPIMYYLTGDKSKGMGFINNIRMNYPEDYLFTEKYISNFEKL